MWTKCGFNNTVPHAIDPEKQFIYLMTHFLTVYSLVSVIRMGLLDSDLDFFLWGYLKSKIYAKKPANTSVLNEKTQYLLHQRVFHIYAKW